MLAPTIGFDNPTEEKRARTVLNTKLYNLGCTDHDGLPLHLIDGWLTEEGFNSLTEGIYCGHEGGVHEQVGPHTWLALTYYRMESGRYEVVAYLS
jgi:hypothetical protein